MDLTFEWDEDKARQNEQKHGVSFAEATTVFGDPFAVTVFDPDHSGDEDRWLDIGMSSKGRTLVVWYTERYETIRIIGSRKATSKERVAYERQEPDFEVREMKTEYDFSGGTRGKHYRAYRSGHTVRVNKSDGTVEERHYTLADGAVMLDPDLRQRFPDSESVNQALRSLVSPA